jgi:hypothetical protein
MTKGRTAYPFGSVAGLNEQQVPPLRYAPVGMTNLLGVDRYFGGPFDEGERSAVLLMDREI